MDDLEFRRQLYTDPDAVQPRAGDDVSRRNACIEAKRFNQQIKHAMQVDVPEGFKSRLLLKQQLNEVKAKPHRRSLHWLALAASIAFISTFSLLNWHSQPVNLGDHAISHVAHEGIAPFSSDERIPLSLINAKLARFNQALQIDVNDIFFASFCMFRKVASMHLVMDSPQGKVTVFIVPHDRGMVLPDRFEDGDMKGIGRDIGFANVLVVGNQQQNLQVAMEQVTANLRVI